ncbi:MAG: tetratricopeptide repeat protein [Flavobacteriales bacterium]|nr:tetratricopeptide repeat protein [Flavobacteriales bacterium]
MLFFLTTPLVSLGTEKDSLLFVLQAEPDNVVRVDLLNRLSKITAIEIIEESKLYADSAFNISKRIGYNEGVVTAYLSIGNYYEEMGDYSKSLENYLAGLSLAEQISNISIVADCYINIGATYYYTSNLELALKNWELAQENYNKANDMDGVGIAIGNISLIYFIQEDYKKAIHYDSLALNMVIEHGNSYQIARAYNNLGGSFHIIEEYELAIENYNKAIEVNLVSEVINYRSIISSYVNLGSVYLETKNYSNAKKYYQYAENTCDSIDNDEQLTNVYEGFTSFYEETENYQEALRYYKLWQTVEDSLFNESKSKDIGRVEAKYEFERKLEEEKRVADEQAKIATEIKSRKDNLQYSGIFVFVLILFAAMFMSGKFSMSEKVAEGLIFFTFLLFFEFCLVLLDPFIDSWSSGEPLYKLLFNGVLAALIFPLHAFFEDTIKSKLFSARRKVVERKLK